MADNKQFLKAVCWQCLSRQSLLHPVGNWTLKSLLVRIGEEMPYLAFANPCAL